MKQTLTISSQGQLTLPKTAREELAIKPGQKMLYHLEYDGAQRGILLIEEPANWYDAMQGSGKDLWGRDPEKYLEKERQSWQK